MLFNSFTFLLFFPIVTIIYFLLPHKFRWFHLLVASCIFYAYFVPIYILILFFTIIVDYIAGILIENAQGRKRKLFLLLSLISNIGILAFFKYYNFFVENVNSLIHFTYHSDKYLPLLSIILPIGLSFHTFQAMSYTIEVYRGNHKAERHFGIYALYVMFFPQLVAGPIERPQNILYQFHEKKTLDYSNLSEGLKLILWGLFKKIVIADRLSMVVTNVYGQPTKFDGCALSLATVFFAFQIYCDFSGYTDIAIGTAKILGFKLMKNFNRPYASKNISEFWKRWHISLSSWFYDYLFDPIVYSLREWRHGAIVLGLLVTFLVSGLWHGAAWHYVIWGLLNGLALTYEALTRKTRKKLFKKLPSGVSNFISIACTFSYVCISYIFFRASNLKEATYIISHLSYGWGHLMSDGHLNSLIKSLGNGDTLIGVFNIIVGFALIFFVQLIEYKTIGQNALDIVAGKHRIFRWGYYYLLIIVILVMGVYQNQEFIYFQF